jgi:hypothetical protein
MLQLREEWEQRLRPMRPRHMGVGQILGNAPHCGRLAQGTSRDHVVDLRSIALRRKPRGTVVAVRAQAIGGMRCNVRRAPPRPVAGRLVSARRGSAARGSNLYRASIGVGPVTTRMSIGALPHGLAKGGRSFGRASRCR